MPNSLFFNFLLKPSVLFVVLLFTSNGYANTALRITCGIENTGEKVYINGKFLGICPMDILAPSGQFTLRFQKQNSAYSDRVANQKNHKANVVVKTAAVIIPVIPVIPVIPKIIFTKIPPMVRIPGKNYEMGKYEVTQDEWQAVMGSNPSKLSSCGDNCPVENVSFNDIKEYLTKLNQKTEQQYRLPTEAEWKYACQGGIQHDYCGSDDANTVGWNDSNSNKKPHPVGLKQANGYGLFDMSGNLLEWLHDCHGADCTNRWMSGGSWYLKPQYSRAAYRSLINDAATRNGSFGFRITRTLP